MNKILFVFTSLMTVATAQATPFLVCDPYPASGAQPDSFIVTMDATAPVTVAAVKDATNQPYLKYDLGPLNLTGSHTVKVRAKNTYSESEDASLTFIAGVPGLPINLRISSQ